MSSEGPVTPESGEDPSSISPGNRRLVALLRLGILGLAAWIAILLPLPILEDWLPVKDILVAAAAVLLIGKGLLDTLFYDRFWP